MKLASSNETRRIIKGFTTQVRSVPLTSLTFLKLFNSPTWYTCGESNVACHRFSSQPLKKNLRMVSMVEK